MGTPIFTNLEGRVPIFRHEHIAVLYRGATDTFRLAPFIAEGLQNGDLCQVVAPTTFQAELLGQLRSQVADLDRHLQAVLRWAKETRIADGRRVIDQEWVQLALARVYAKVDALKLTNWQVAAVLTDGDLSPADASAMKVFGTELRVSALRALMDVVGQTAALQGDAPGAALHGQLEQAYRQAPVGTFGGGVNEVQREIIALAGLGMPRAPR